MSGKHCNLMNIPAATCQVGEAKVPECMGTELDDPRPLGDPSNHLRPGPDRNRLCTISIGVRQEQRAPCLAQHTSLLQVPDVQLGSCLRIRDDTSASILG